jgi:hypothetical protein
MAKRSDKEKQAVKKRDTSSRIPDTEILLTEKDEEKAAGERTKKATERAKSKTI